MLNRLSQSGKILIVLHTPNAITRFDETRRDTPAYAEIVRTLAHQHQVILVDQEKLWLEHGSPIEYLLDDGTIHPNSAGHVLMAHNLLKVLNLWDPASAVCRLFIP